MKKLFAILLIVVLVFALTACGTSLPNNTNTSSSNSGSAVETSAPAPTSAPEPTESDLKDYSFGAMKVTLPSDFKERNDLIPEGSDVQYFYANGDSNVAFVALSESKSEFEGTVVKSLDDYLDVQHDNSKGDITSSIKEDNGLKYFDYEADGTNGTTYKYFSTAYETDDDYWFVQMYTTKALYPLYEDDFISWAHSVREA